MAARTAAVLTEAVVNSRGRIHGLTGGYVVDASIMPVAPRANTNLPAVWSPSGWQRYWGRANHRGPQDKEAVWPGSH